MALGGNRHGTLGRTFQVTRILQAVSLIAIIGMTANFISEMVSAGAHPPDELIATIAIVGVAVLWCAYSFIAFMDDRLSFILAIGLDTVLLIALVIIAVIVGRPLSYLKCELKSALAFGQGIENMLNKVHVDYGNWIGATKTICYEMKAVWGLAIALCILFAFSGICLVSLWRRRKEDEKAYGGSRAVGDF